MTALPARRSRDAAPATARRPRGRRGARSSHLNRELSWIEFNARILDEARDERNPLLERVRFLSIFATNLDEFFQVRISGLRQQVRAGRVASLAGDATPEAQLEAARERILELVAAESTIFRGLRKALASEGIEIVGYGAIPEDHAALRQRFIDEIYPVLTPLAIDPGHPFPYISTLTLSIAVGLRDPETAERHFARVKVPQVLPRLLELERRDDQPAGTHRFVPIEQVIEANLDLLFAGMEILDHHLFRVTRNADIELEDDEADDLLLAIEEELRRRRFGEAVRLEVERSMPEATRNLLQRGVGLTASETYEVRGMLDLSGLAPLVELDRPDLRVAPWSPVTPPRLAPPADDEAADVFAVIRSGDVLVHHPYESFTASVGRFLAQAADDPDVLTIKLTLYRTSGESSVVAELIRAAEAGKQIVVIVEIKARFDEQANIGWARKLERAGAHVVYGLVGLKTHSKMLLVVRREGSILRRYVHIGTGNYNSGTARSYTDLGLLTCRPEIGQDISDLFNILTGLSRQQTFQRLLVAPMTLRSRFLELVDREVEHRAAGRPAGIILKMNALVDRACVEAMYRASNAGVGIDLIVRGACTLIPGVPGMSEHIRVRSVIGEFLEHSRIWRFENGGSPERYIGSADLMDRNLDRRVEVFTPIDDPDAQHEIDGILGTMLADDRRAWLLDSNGGWHRAQSAAGPAGTVDTHRVLRDQALARASAGSVPRRPHATGGSLEPWA
jgi:polyphosphate kinase